MSILKLRAPAAKLTSRLHGWKHLHGWKPLLRTLVPVLFYDQTQFCVISSDILLTWLDLYQYFAYRRLAGSKVDDLVSDRTFSSSWILAENSWRSMLSVSSFFLSSATSFSRVEALSCSWDRAWFILAQTPSTFPLTYSFSASTASNSFFSLWSSLPADSFSATTCSSSSWVIFICFSGSLIRSAKALWWPASASSLLTSASSDAAFCFELGLQLRGVLRELAQEKIELWEEKATLKNETKQLQTHLQQRLRIMMPWLGMDPSLMMGAAPYGYPMAVPQAVSDPPPPLEPNQSSMSAAVPLSLIAPALGLGMDPSLMMGAAPYGYPMVVPQAVSGPPPPPEPNQSNMPTAVPLSLIAPAPYIPMPAITFVHPALQAHGVFANRPGETGAHVIPYPHYPPPPPPQVNSHSHVERPYAQYPSQYPFPLQPLPAYLMQMQPHQSQTPISGAAPIPPVYRSYTPGMCVMAPQPQANQPNLQARADQLPVATYAHYPTSALQSFSRPSQSPQSSGAQVIQTTLQLQTPAQSQPQKAPPVSPDNSTEVSSKAQVENLKLLTVPIEQMDHTTMDNVNASKVNKSNKRPGPADRNLSKKGHYGKEEAARAYTEEAVREDLQGHSILTDDEQQQILNLVQGRLVSSKFMNKRMDDVLRSLRDGKGVEECARRMKFLTAKWKEYNQAAEPEELLRQLKRQIFTLEQNVEKLSLTSLVEVRDIDIIRGEDFLILPEDEKTHFISVQDKSGVEVAGMIVECIPEAVMQNVRELGVALHARNLQ
ncbi:hypothetical protein R1sor_020666 [Riccia sorocarpa]|uniref:Uncharacterized protein n=1 Tax=Riccia sorocarpa TaxID=122646 RepID=A0ABD3GI57_9MARC